MKKFFVVLALALALVATPAVPQVTAQVVCVGKDCALNLPPLVYLERTLTEAELETCFSSPIVLVTGVAGKIHWVERAIFRKPAGTNTVGGLTALVGSYPSSGFNWAAIVPVGGLSDTGVVTTQWGIGTSTAPAGVHAMVGTNLVVKCSGADPTDMPTGLLVKIWYRTHE